MAETPHQNPIQTGPAAASRLANIERLRILAMLEIVAFHIGGDRGLVIGGVGLATFLLLTNLFNGLVAQKRGFATFARDKVRRLAGPWLFWCGVYAALHIAESWWHGEPLLARFSWWMLLYGTETHLWFVPFAMLGGITVGWLQTRVPQAQRARAAACAMLVGFPVLFGAAWLLLHTHAPVPIPQYLYALPAPLLGLALGLILQTVGQQRRALFWILGMSIITTLIVAFTTGITTMTTRYSIMAAIIPLVFLHPGRLDIVSRVTIPVLFGVYLIHPLVIRLCLPLISLEDHLITGTALVFILSAVFIAAIQRTPLRWAT